MFAAKDKLDPKDGSTKWRYDVEGATTETTTLTRMLRWIAPITTSSVRAPIAMPA